MKHSVKKISVLLIFALICSEISAKEFLNHDSTLVNYKSSDTAKVKPFLFLNISTGLLINKTFGYHPLFNLYFKYRYKLNYTKLVYEHRFGDSRNSYSVIDNDTLKAIKTYKSNFIGLEYERVLFENPYHDLYSIIGLGYDWIEILRNEKIENYKLIGGLMTNIGLGYTFYIHKKHGPNIEILYHMGKLKNKGTADLNNSSMIIRLNYYFNNMN
jgi:hypothetical protein